MFEAFNTTFAGALAAGTVGEPSTAVLVDGDDADSKSTLAGVLTAAGLRAMDAGPRNRAREMEAVGFP